jgi:hypothetical protein
MKVQVGWKTGASQFLRGQRAGGLVSETLSLIPAFSPRRRRNIRRFLNDLRLDLPDTRSQNKKRPTLSWPDGLKRHESVFWLALILTFSPGEKERFL